MEPFNQALVTNPTIDASKLAGIEDGAEVNNISDVNATDLTDGGDSTLHYHSADRARANHTGTQTASTISDFDTEVSNNSTVAANTSKLAGIEAGAEVNNISDTNATDLTDGGDSTLHYHSADRSRANHTGTQTLSTISDAGTIASQNSNSVTITGGSITGITDLAVADGGTGASTASAARTNLEVYSDAEVDAKVATKAVAGGVEINGGVADVSASVVANAVWSFHARVVIDWDAKVNHDLLNCSGTTSPDWFYFRFDRTNRRLIFYADITASDSLNTGAVFNPSPLTGKVVYNVGVDWTDGGNVNIWLNGQIVATKAAWTDFASFGNTSIRLFGYSTTDGNRFQGYTQSPFWFFNRALSASEVADLYESGTVADADRWGVPGGAIGCIAAYPMDEGIGYQLHDISSNHYDGLLSTSGFTHLVPKTEGKVRVKAADASSAAYMLRSGDILPTNAIVDNVLSEERFVDLTNSAQTLDDYRIRLNPSGSDLQIQRSDGSNHQTLGTVTAPSSLSDVDVEVNYKQVAR